MARNLFLSNARIHRQFIYYFVNYIKSLLIPLNRYLWFYFKTIFQEISIQGWQIPSIPCETGGKEITNSEINMQ